MQKQKMKVGHISGNTSSLIFDIVNTILLLMVCVITLYPFLNTVAISFNDSTDAVYGGIYLWPRVFSLRSYETILLQSSTIPHSALISALRAVIGTALSIPLSMMLAYVMSRRDFVLRSAVTKLVLFTMYVSGGLIPTFLTYRAYGLMNNFLVYILPGCISAFNVLVMRSFIQARANTGSCSASCSRCPCRSSRPSACSSASASGTSGLTPCSTVPAKRT